MEISVTANLVVHIALPIALEWTARARADSFICGDPTATGTGT